MRSLLGISALLLAVCGVGELLYGDEPKPPQFVIALRITSVDEDGSEKVLASPKLATLEGRSASFLAGGEVAVEGAAKDQVKFMEFGHRVQMTLHRRDTGAVRLEATMERTAVAHHQGDDVQVQGHVWRCFQTMKPGEPVKFITEKDAQGNPMTRLEVTITETAF